MRVLLIAIFSIVLFLTGCASAATKTGEVIQEQNEVEKVNNELESKKVNFKEFTWGISIDEVKDAEKNSDILTEQDDLLRYESSLLDYNADLFYIFDENGKLDKGIYNIYKNPREQEHYSEEDELNALEEIKTELISLYGEPNGRTPDGEESYIIYSWSTLPDTDISLLYLDNRLSVNFKKKKEESDFSTPKEENETEQNQQSNEMIDDEENPDSIIRIKDGKFYMKGITLGMSSKEVLRVLGEPLYNGEDPEDISDTITEYNDITIRYYSDSATSIFYNGDLNLEETINIYSGPKYKSDDPLYFLFSPEGHMIVKITPNGNTYQVHLVYEDPNFHYSVDHGVYTKIE